MALRRVRTSVVCAAGFAFAYSVIAVIRYVGDRRALRALDLSLPELLAVYWVGALLAGVIVGVLWPIARHAAGAPVVGILAAFPLMCGVVLLRSGSHRTATEIAVYGGVLAVILGGLGGGILQYMLVEDGQG